jgi:uncharacterized protein (DUF433 family)
MRALKDIYGGWGPLDAPAYAVAEAAHHLGLPLTTVRYWTLGRDNHKPVIRIADPVEKALSFRNLVELHVLSAVRRQHNVSLPSIRKAVAFLGSKFRSVHPLSSVVIDPRVQFGRPCLTGTGIPTAELIQRFKAGEDLSSLADDFGRDVSDVVEAIRYETDLQAA